MPAGGTTTVYNIPFTGSASMKGQKNPWKKDVIKKEDVHDEEEYKPGEEEDLKEEEKLDATLRPIFQTDAPCQRLVYTLDFTVKKEVEVDLPDGSGTITETKKLSRNVDVMNITIQPPFQCTHIEVRGKSGIDRKEYVLCPKVQLRTMFEHKKLLASIRGNNAAEAAKNQLDLATASPLVLQARRTEGGAMTEARVFFLNLWEPIDRINFGAISVGGAYCKDPSSCAVKGPAAPIPTPMVPTTTVKPTPIPVKAEVGGGAAGTSHHKPKAGMTTKADVPATKPEPVAGKKREFDESELFPVSFGGGGDGGSETEEDEGMPPPVAKPPMSVVKTPAITSPPKTTVVPPPPPPVPVPSAAASAPTVPPVVEMVNIKTILKGVVIVLSGFVNPLRSEIRDKALSLGARVENNWSGACTHLICATANTPKFLEVKSSGHGTIVTKDWVLDSWSKKNRQSEDYYLLGGAPAGGASPPTKKFKPGGGPGAGGGSVL